MKPGQQVAQELERKQRENRLHQFVLDELRAVLNTASGRTVLARILGECEVNKSELIAETNRMYFHAGMRHMGVFVKALIKEASPRKFAEIIQESERISNFFETSSEADLKVALSEAQSRGRTETVEIKP